MVGFSPNHSGDRFYNPPAIRRLKKLRQQRLLEEEQERGRREEEERRRLGSGEADSSGLDGSPAAEGSLSVGTPLPQRPNGNLDRFLVSTTPVVPALFSPQTRGRGWRNNQSHPYFCLGDLWEAFKEWSAYGAGVPLVMNGSDSVVQYYVPYLSGIQLYVDCSKPPFKTRHLGEETDLDPSQEMSTDGSDSENIERCVQLGLRGQKSLAEFSLVKMDRLSLSEKPLHIQEKFSNDDGESASCSLAFEYMERDPPYSREPLAEKISSLASRFPELRTYTSCDLSPGSWISVAWYPIYRIPTGPTLRDLEACFLTYHKLSTKIIGVSNSQGSFSTVKKIVNSADMSPKLSLPVFGLASYKFKASVWTSNWLNEREQATRLMQTANKWLENLHVNHPDFKFFASHDTYQR